jgi:hypothetical protein
MSNVVELIKEKINDAPVSDADLERMLEFRLSDAMREGSSVTEQAFTWGAGTKACALSAAAISMRARGYI